MNPEIKRHFEMAQAAKAAFIEIILQTGPEGRVFRTEPDAWNMLQVMEHLYRAEDGVRKQLLKYGQGNGKQAGLSSGLRSIAMRLFMRSPARIKVPAAAGAQIIPTGELTFDDLKTQWDQLRSEIGIWVEAYPSDKADRYVFKHPVGGLFTPVQTLRFMEDHIVHHIKQLNRIREAWQSK